MAWKGLVKKWYFALPLLYMLFSTRNYNDIPILRGQVGFSKERAIEFYHNLGLTKAKTITHIVERKALLVVEAQQQYGLKL
jgi:hypothetical protein